MEKYHKIKTVFKRDPNNNYKTLIMGEYAIPEFEYLAENQWVFTEKVDGTNIRIVFDGENVSYRGKTDRAQLYPGLLDRLHFLFDSKIEQLKDMFPDGVCLYGEGYGVKIQKGGGNYFPDRQDFVLFDVKVGNWWLQRGDIEDIANELILETVPIVGTGTLLEMVEIAQGGFKSDWGAFPAEGIVARPKVELQTRGGERIITKIKHRDFRS